jgi:hypothetical protein
MGVVVLGTFVALVGVAQGAAPSSFDHSAWHRILTEYVDDDGLVAYRRLGEAGRGDLDAYLARVADARPQQWSETEQIAFWINAYNAGIVAGILDGYSPESALSRARLFRWYSFAITGKKRTPDEVEHDILRKQFTEPRIHFALVCAATSCPKLRREAYRGDILDRQLDGQARRFINDPKRNVVDPGKGLRLSTIFKWFAEDFAKSDKSLNEYVAAYVEDPRHAEYVEKFDGEIEFLEYDWGLNAQVERPEKSSRSTTESPKDLDNRACSLGNRQAVEAAPECTGDRHG